IFNDSQSLELENCIRELETSCARLAEQLSTSRRESACRLEKAMRLELDSLKMTEVTFQVQLTCQPDAQGLRLSDGRSYHAGISGIDEATFLVMTNPGEMPRPLAK